MRPYSPAGLARAHWLSKKNTYQGMRLCSKHAVEAGTKSSHKAGASTAACEALHVLAKQEDLVVLRHVHFAPGEEPEGARARRQPPRSR